MKVLIASLTEEETTLFKKKLETLSQLVSGIQYLSSSPQQVSQFIDRSIKLVVINLQHFRPAQKEMIKSLRSVGYLGPIMIVARPHSPELIRECEKLENVSFVEKPFETRDLVGIAYKLLQTRNVKQRIFRRYRTDQSAQIQLYTNEEMQAQALVSNLSKGGALLEGVFSEIFKVGELLRVQFHLNELDRLYSVPARVVWKKDQKGHEGLGIEFVRNEDVYKFLMSSF